ncbi:MAG: thioredoxin domain-containing protein [Chloroflexi bacterium]|nr:thioredoxin domain-containing protein [Chloroflexota bacterium]
MSNRLANETSPYLLQHAENPVDWYAWGEEALSKAKAENKPIFLSIGYAACHWCHVMAHESFEDPTTAALMNKYYVNVKVDREERPDLDAIYMQATVGMTGQGGWPMSVFLTPDGVPFYAGTYFPNAPRHGMPSFREVLLSLAEAWVNQQDAVERTTRSLLDFYHQESGLAGSAEVRVDASVADAAVQALNQGFDRVNGGWGRAPKFPQPMAVEFLLSYYSRTHNEAAWNMAEATLTHMARGGIYDQLGGGFHRYSTDAVWLVPHFEKMLYDNSQLARAYLHAWQMVSRKQEGDNSVAPAAEPVERLYKRVAVEILDYVMLEMTHPEGGFYSTQDADSEGVEGKYFVWTPDETWTILGDEAVLFNDVYDVTRQGNFDGASILHVAGEPRAVAKAHNIPLEQLQSILAEARLKLFEARSRRVRPGRDEKVLTAWNGLMMAAFAEAARWLKRADYQQIAVRNAEFVLRELRIPQGRLMRSWKAGSGAKLNGYLEDYTHLIEGLLALYQTTFEARWFVAARELADVMLAHFAAPDGTFYDTSDDHEALVTRPRDLQDNAVPAGNSMAATVLLKLGAYTGESRYIDTAEKTLRALQNSFSQHPAAFGQWLVALEYMIGKAREIAIVGDPAQPDARALLDVIFAGYRPHQVVALKRPGEESPIPLLAMRDQLNGKATAYVCRNLTCQMPVNEPGALAGQLEIGD